MDKNRDKNTGVIMGSEHRTVHSFGKPRHTSTIRGAGSRSKYVPHVGKKQLAKAS